MHAPELSDLTGEEIRARDAGAAVADSWAAPEEAAILDSLGTGIWVLDPDCRCVYINTEACQILGYPREECLGRKIQCRFHSGCPEGWACGEGACQFQQAIANGAPLQVDDDVFYRRDGTSFAVRYSVRPMIVRGRNRGAVVSFMNIAEQKRADQELRKSNQWLQFAQNVAGVGIFELDLTTNKVTVSQGQFRIYGLDPADKWPSRDEWRKLIHPEDREHMDRRYDMALTGAQLPAEDFRVVWPDGSVHWLHARPQVLLDEAGQPTRLISISVDISDRIKAETALNQFFAKSPTPMAIWGFDGRVQRVNAAWEPIFGFTAAELEGMQLLDRVHPEDRPAAAAEFEAILVSGKRTGIECRWQCKDGSYRWLLVDAQAQTDARTIYATAYDITQLKTTEQELRGSEARFRSAFERSPIGMAIVGLDGRFQQANQSLCRLTGFSEQELTERNFAQITHPEDLRKSTELNGALLGGSVPGGTVTKRYIRKDGGTVWVSAHIALERDGQGNPLRFITLVMDLSDQKAAEEAARVSEAWLRFALNAAGIGLCYRESGETVASEEQFRLYGLEPAEEWLSRENWLRRLHPEDRERVDLEQRLALERGEAYDIQFRVVWPDRSVHWLMCRGKADRHKGASWKVEITVDVTDRHHAEAALDEFFSISRSPMAILDLEGRIKRANGALSRISGFNADELAQRPAAEFFHPDDRGIVQAELERLITQGGDAGFECRGVRKDGALIWLDFCAAVSRDEGLIYTVAADVTERKSMIQAMRDHAEKLARSNEELERFAYVASHDLQEPLRMVAGFTQLLSKKYSGRLDETADRYIDYAVDGAKRMQQLISDLLAYSRVNRQELDPRRTECDAVVRTSIQNLRAAIDESGAVVESDPLPVLMADPAQLGQLFQNLIGNAIKFRGQAPPRVHITAADQGAQWLFSVRDNGIGIDPRHADRIFQIFQRLHTRAQYPGTGIGLAVCHKVVERHGGRIWVESQPGAGSDFRFILPKRQTE